MPKPFPPAPVTAPKKTVTFPQPQPQYPTIQFLFKDLKRRFAVELPSLAARSDDFDFEEHVNSDGRSGYLRLMITKHGNPWSVFRDVTLEIEDNRVVRRVEEERPIAAYWDGEYS